MPVDPNSAAEIFDRVSIPIAYKMGYLTNNYREPSFRAIEAQHGITRPEILVLIFLAACDGSSASEICEFSGHLKTNISRAVIALHRKRLIRRMPAKEDQRRQLLYMTAQGRELHRQFMPLLDQRERAMMQPLSPAERTRFEELLGKLCGYVPEWRSDTIAPRA
ncbi:MAG: MarR family winged helix-turn-helix transcriptional regulator [Lautropia sp.]